MKGHEEVKRLLNIGKYHQAHERFHGENFLRIACELIREAKGLKVLADRWLGDLPSVPPVEMEDSRFWVMGCDDLNQLAAIPFMGTLFMEGEREPRELVDLRHRLRSVAEALKGRGQWLSGAIDRGLEREKRLICPELIGVVRSRYEIQALGWIRAREITLAGELILFSLECLEKMDLSPAALRKSPEAREEAASLFRQAGWLLDEAGRLLAKTGGRVTMGDRHWQNYIDHLKESVTAA